MQFIRIFLIAFCLLAPTACKVPHSEAQTNQNQASATDSAPRVFADDFAYPIGKTETATQARDKKDEWYNAQDFGANNHLGEDWNKNSGGNTDCGEPVFAAASGTIVLAENVNASWGNVVIIEHNLPGGKKVQTLYGHLQTILKTSGTVKKREQIGTIGNADGRYFCHLHFELREENCPEWNKAGVGYSAENKGWLDPSNFIDRNR